MTDPYTPTTEEVRCAWCDEIARGYASVEPGFPIANLSCGEHGSDFTPDGDLFKSWLAAHDAQVREEGAKAMREAAAVEAESSTNPAGFGHGSLNEGSRSQWYAHGKRDSAAVIRALPIPSTGTERELVKDNGDACTDMCCVNPSSLPAPVDRLAVLREVIGHVQMMGDDPLAATLAEHFGVAPVSAQS